MQERGWAGQIGVCERKLEAALNHIIFCRHFSNGITFAFTFFNLFHVVSVVALNSFLILVKTNM